MRCSEILWDDLRYLEVRLQKKTSHLQDLCFFRWLGLRDRRRNSACRSEGTAFLPLPNPSLFIGSECADQFMSNHVHTNSQWWWTSSLSEIWPHRLRICIWFMLVHQLCKSLNLKNTASRSHGFDVNMTWIRRLEKHKFQQVFRTERSESSQDRSMRSVQQFEHLATLLEMPLYKDFLVSALLILAKTDRLESQNVLQLLGSLEGRWTSWDGCPCRQAQRGPGFYTLRRIVQDVERHIKACNMYSVYATDLTSDSAFWVPTRQGLPGHLWLPE